MFKKKPEFITSSASLYEFDGQRRVDRESLLNSVYQRKTFAQQIEEQAKKRLDVIQAAYQTDAT